MLKKSITMKLLMALAVCTLSFLSIAQAATLSGSNTISIVASDNAWVKVGFGDQDESSTLLVSMNSGVGDLSYLRFDISSLALMTNVLSAQLNFYKVLEVFSMEPAISS